MSRPEDTSSAYARTGVRQRPPLVLILKPEDPNPTFHRWAVRDGRGRARPALLSNGLPVRWTGCGRFQLDVKSPAIRRDHADLIGRPCASCFGGEA